MEGYGKNNTSAPEVQSTTGNVNKKVDYKLIKGDMNEQEIFKEISEAHQVQGVRKINTDQANCV